MDDQIKDFMQKIEAEEDHIIEKEEVNPEEEIVLEKLNLGDTDVPLPELKRDESALLENINKKGKKFLLLCSRSEELLYRECLDVKRRECNLRRYSSTAEIDYELVKCAHSFSYGCQTSPEKDI